MSKLFWPKLVSVLQHNLQKVVFAFQFFLEYFPLAELDYLVGVLDHQYFEALLSGDQVSEVFDVLDPQQVGGAEMVATPQLNDLKLFVQRIVVMVFRGAVVAQLRVVLATLAVDDPDRAVEDEG